MIGVMSPMRGYYKDPEKTAKVIREIEGERWVFPGDYARVEANGEITLLGRGSGCINTAGEKVFPEEVEEALKECDLVQDSLVVGIADEQYGERVVAVVELGQGAISEAELRNFCRKKIAGYKVPKSIIFVDKVHRAPNGKADYKWAKSVVVDSWLQ